METESKHLTDEKQPYSKPRLTIYGSIVELTQTKAGVCRDNENAFNNAEPPPGETCS